MNSLLIGGLLAFILNVPMKKIEDLIEKVSFLKKSKRALAILGVLIAFILIVTGLVLIVLPTLVTTVSELVSVSSTAVPKSINALTSFYSLMACYLVRLANKLRVYWTN